MRPIKELLQIVLENVNRINESTGICGLCILSVTLMCEGVITRKEGLLIETYVYKNTIKRKGSNYRFPIYKIEPRKKWLTEQISKL